MARFEIKKPLPTTKVADVLKNIYYDIKHPASLGGIAKLAKASRVSKLKAKKWLMTQDAYTLHKPVRYKFPRRKTLSYGIGDLIQCDLVDMSKFARENSGMKYLLTAIDVFSKKAYAIPIKNKNATSVAAALTKLIYEIKKITHLQTDFGKEFYNKQVNEVMKKHNINHYSTKSEMKAAVVERFNRTLKNKLYRIFTHRNSTKYVDVLYSVLDSYNESVHRSTGYAPSRVTPKEESLIFERLYGYGAKPRFKFNINDQVRISKARKIFQRGYLPSWSDEIFIIYKRYPTSPSTYLLKDLKGEELSGRFYEFELQKVIKHSSDYWRIEKILKSKKKGNEKEYYVKWKGFDRRFNSWVKESWLKS